jgi:assimilatory nitrate reductase catalytic subunit
MKGVSRAPGQALADFAIFKLIADAWGCGGLFEQWRTPEDTFQILKRISRDRPCDFTGIADYRTIDEMGGVQWPYPDTGSADGSVAGPERRLFEDGRYYHPDGRAVFCFEEPRPVREATSKRYPLVLLTGRGSASQWHTETRTGKSPILRSLSARHPYVEISPSDADARRISPEDWVIVVSARGSMRARAFVTSTVAPGQVFVPMHDARTNQLTDPSFDPYSRQPSYKHCAVDVRLPQPGDA